VGGGRYDPARTVAVLKEIDPDIAAIQEIGGYTVEGGEQAPYFARELQLACIPGMSLKRRRTQFGNALMVKGVVHETRLIDLTVRPFEPRSAIDAIVEVRNTPIRVIATHLGLSRRERRSQIARIAGLLEAEQHRLTILLGDFNVFGPERAVLKRIGAPMPLPKLRSFPARRPLMSLDRLWTIPNDFLMSLVVHRTPLSRVASDHLPLVAEVALPPAMPSGSSEDEEDLALEEAR
jgi:endonuclease/exonuclease/phosphatase family metal-dependent hydrolase